ncbi:MAG: Ig-like domain-containing protein [Armatimonadota bacterium]|nr:hypothetical protein [bacterium]
MLKKIIFILYMLIAGSAVLASQFDFPATEVYRIRIHNQVGGLVQVSLDFGNTYSTVGRVKIAANARITGFAASSYTPEGTVAATAVHGIRVKTGQSASGLGKAQIPLIFSITPAEFAAIPHGFGGHIARSSGIITDIHTGQSIFRCFSPYVGNPVFVEHDHSLQPVPEDYIPIVGETFVIIVKRPSVMPLGIEFENHTGGSVTVKYSDDKSDIIATVVRPVSAVGRYDATTFTGVGAINTNHGGVLTISTAPVCPIGTQEGGPVETRGGFMVQPNKHAAEQRETSPQVMVIKPTETFGPRLEGMPPMYGGYINLMWLPDKPELSCRAQVKIDDEDWENVPEIVGKVNDAFTPTYLTQYFTKLGKPRQVQKGLTAVRLLFPPYDAKLMEDQLRCESAAYTAETAKSSMKAVRGIIPLQPKKPKLEAIVSFYIDSAPVCTTSTYPYRYDWDSTRVPNGFHSIQIETITDSNSDPQIEESNILIKN